MERPLPGAKIGRRGSDVFRLSVRTLNHLAGADRCFPGETPGLTQPRPGALDRRLQRLSSRLVLLDVASPGRRPGGRVYT